MTDQPTPNNPKAQIRAFVERINRLEEEKSAIVSDISDVKKEAKGVGLNPRHLTALAALVRKKDKATVTAERDEFELYLDAFDFLN